jgi:hypothetical protein
MADRAGLEPATSALTERRSDRLNYLPKKKKFLVEQHRPIANRKSRKVGKRGGKIALADERQMCLLQTKEGNFQHSFVLANLPARVCLGKTVKKK